MKLSEGKCKKEYRILHLHVPAQTKDRLQSLGMTVHTAITIMQKKHNGTMVIDLRGTRFALGDQLTKEIEVEPCQKK